MGNNEIHVYEVWDRPTRWFHWINVLAVLALIGLGVTILNAGALGATDEGKILLKTLHVLVGYVFATNIAIRLIWGFIGNSYARWHSILPGGRGYFKAMKDHLGGLIAGTSKPWLGHNPLGRISITVMLLLLTTQAVTGLTLAGTDIFFPPFGGWIAEWVAAPGVDPATLVPYAKEMYDEQAYAEMRDFRSSFITLHKYSFYALVTIIPIHILGTIITEIRGGETQISAMFTGRKIIAGPPADADSAGETTDGVSSAL